VGNGWVIEGLGKWHRWAIADLKFNHCMADGKYQAIRILRPDCADEIEGDGRASSARPVAKRTQQNAHT